MTMTATLLGRAPGLSTAELGALQSALEHNDCPEFSPVGVLRLAIYRRAVLAGLFTDRIEGQEPRP